MEPAQGSLLSPLIFVGFLLIFTFLWLSKNIIVSGCLLYPVKSLCFENLFWSNLKKVELVSDENESWTKGWPDYVKIQNQNNEKIISNKDFPMPVLIPS